MTQDEDDLEATAFANHAIRVSEHYSDYIVIARKGDLLLWKASDRSFALKGMSSVNASISQILEDKNDMLNEKEAELAQREEGTDGFKD